MLALIGHRDAVVDCAVTPNGFVLVSASYDEKLILWDIRYQKKLASLSGHNNRVSACNVTCDGSTIVSSSCDGKLML